MKRFAFLIIGLFCTTMTVLSQSGLETSEDFLVKDVYGNSHTLNSYLEEGKIVVVPFFTTTCGSCNIYTPEIVESFQDFGCNNGNVFYLGVNWGADNIGVIDFMAVHAVEYPCASGIEGLGNDVHMQYEIASNITALVILPDGSIAGQFYGPDHYPTRDSLNNLLLSLGAEMQSCGVGIEEGFHSGLSVYPNPVSDHFNIQFLNHISGEYNLKVYNINANIVKSQKLYLNHQQRIEINTNDLKNGIYFIQLMRGDEIIINQTLIKN